MAMKQKSKGQLMIIIPQTKGGVGKSTVAMQVIAPYLYKKHGKKVTYIEIDDENNDSRSFTRTEIVNKKMLGTNRLTDLDELILMDDNHEVILLPILNILSNGLGL